MSLLLDALKEAETRHRQTSAASEPIADEASTPPDATLRLLALAEDAPPPAPPPAARVVPRAAVPAPPLAVAPASAETVRVADIAALRAARLAPHADADATATAQTASPAPPSRPASGRLLLLVVGLSVLVAVLGASYLYLTASTSMTPVQPPAAAAPPTMPASTGVPPATADLPQATVPTVAPSVLPTVTGIPAARPQVPALTHRPAPVASPHPEPAARVAATPARPRPDAAPVAAARLIIEGRPSPLTQAHAALRAGDVVTAERLYRETLATQPDQADAHLGLALIEESRGAVGAAAAHFRAVLNVAPTMPQAWAGLAEIAGDAELESIESQLRGLIASHPEASLHFALGNVLARQSRWADAQQSFYAASTAAPQNADYAFNLAVALDRMGKGKAAVTHYLRALELAADARAVQFDADAARRRLAELQAVAQ